MYRPRSVNIWPYRKTAGIRNASYATDANVCVILFLHYVVSYTLSFGAFYLFNGKTPFEQRMGRRISLLQKKNVGIPKTACGAQCGAHNWRFFNSEN